MKDEDGTVVGEQMVEYLACFEKVVGLYLEKMVLWLFELEDLLANPCDRQMTRADVDTNHFISNGSLYLIIP